MNITVQLAVLAGILGVIMAIVNAALSEWSKRRDADAKRKDREEEYARQDEVARRLVETGAKVDEKLNAIHILVNSNMTAARTAERDALVLLVAALKRIGPGYLGINEIERAEGRIAELNTILADRLAAQQALDHAAAIAADAAQLRLQLTTLKGVQA